eukprot:CAMPEP_0197184016 /NCGR_PEP_ID=MMETSP1423-20130617/9012_1 /TAXON_ID=476441 /ORGANISM="Pseudo-nitzschia heimii, Strain UNC1101" /LENGTH=315 /DNA_ID=CAMNT_0042634725 /DNA_START=66 /DNA_END=1010 /DNA_ORIENTATION=+
MSAIPSKAYTSHYATNFEVYVSKPDFKFNAGHFVAYRGFRERLHGHNYTVGVRLLGSRKINHDGYVLDFGDVKKVVKVVCKTLNERFLCPTKSDVIDIKIVDSVNEKTNGDNGVKSKTVVLVCEDGSRFVIPHDDCAMLPIVHATVEELSIYIWGEIMDGLDPDFLRRRGIHTMEVITAEAPGQEAVFRHEIPTEKSRFDIPGFIMSGEVEIEPMPCLQKGSERIKIEPKSSMNEKQNEGSAKKLRESDTIVPSQHHSDTKSSPETFDIKHKCFDEACSQSEFSQQLERLASALNKTPRPIHVTADDLRAILEKK